MVGAVITAAVGTLGYPLDPTSHREEVFQRGGLLASIGDVGFIRLEERHDGCVHAPQEALVDRNSQCRRRDALGDGLQRVQIGTPKVRMPIGVVVVVLMVRRVVLGSNGRVVVREAVIGHDPAVADQHESVYQAVLTDTLFSRCRSEPRIAGPRLTRRLAAGLFRATNHQKRQRQQSESFTSAWHASRLHVNHLDLFSAVGSHRSRI